MESTQTKLQKHIRFHCMCGQVVVVTLLLSLCVTAYLPDVEAALEFTVTTDNDMMSTYEPALKFIPLADMTSPADIQSPVPDKYSLTTPMLTPLHSIPWWTSSSYFKSSIPSITTMSKGETETDSTPTAKLTSQTWSSQPKIISNSTKNSTARLSSLTSIVSTSSATVPSTSPATVTSEMSVTPVIAVQPTEKTPLILAVTTELSDLTTTLFVSTPVAFRSSHFCNRTRSVIYFGKCGQCSNIPECKMGDVRDSIVKCFIGSPGCMNKCVHFHLESVCCQGYWGENCDVLVTECPGGSASPCNHHGECQTSTWTCLCQSGFTGTACELCEDKTKYGPDCTEDLLSDTTLSDLIQTTTTELSTTQLSTTPFLSTTIAVISSNFCNETRNHTYLTFCSPCSIKQQCRAGDVEVSSKSCRLGFFPGCMTKCLRTYEAPVCCQGYWGDNCDDCPGGHENPCNGHGTCVASNGICHCQSGFTGTACELCEDTTKYGPECSRDCSCVNGVCSSGILGDGSCNCDSGFKGEKCDTEIENCSNLTCNTGSVNSWRCTDVNGTAACVCAVGYELAPNQSSCIAKNPCNTPIYPCGMNSHCEKTGPGTNNCTCKDDYTGDGIVCLPIDPCQTNRGGCESTTICKYTRPNQRVCLCRIGYENYISGIGCTLENICTRSSCDRNAVCTTVEPLRVRCRCKEGYTGNGTICFGNILERIKDINNNNPRFRQDLTNAIKLISKFYTEPLTQHGPFTIFLPNDRAFRVNKGFNKFIDDEDRAMQILRQHILIGQFTLDDLQSVDTFYTLQGNVAQLQVRVVSDIFRYKLQGGTDRAKILAKDFIASNGIIHIVNNLLTLEPEVAGDKKKTAMDLIKLEGTYNRFETLIMSAGLADIFTQPNITVFAPENGAWDALPTGTLEYLMKDEEGQEKLKVVLKNHVFPGVIGVTDLVNIKNIESLAGVKTMVTVSNLGQILLNGKIGVSQVNIPCSTGLYHHVEAVIVPSYIDQLFPNMCSVVLNKEAKGNCQMCGEKLRCPQSLDILTEKREMCWDYYFTRSFPGCAPICNRTVKVSKCCSGFHGSSCIPCPGGFKTPCNGNGQCSDSMTGSGLCFCDRDFIGTACDRCRQKDVFGPICNETCTCLYGHCDEGPKGTGLCKKDSCQQGYQGENCNKKLLMCHGDEILCHAHAKCFLDDSNVSRCQCEMGYEGQGDECTEVDPCLRDDNGGCHQQATCTKIGPGVSHCECDSGWFGDGFFCSPKTLCDDHTDCDVNANCHNSEPGQYHCICKIGYRGDGMTCSLFNVCVENNGGCHAKAICTPLKAGERNCTCPEDLAGDGFTCTGTIADQIMVHPNLTRLARLLKVVKKANNMLNNLEDSFTLFAPSDVAMETFMSWFNSWNRTSYWLDEENVIWFLNFHTLYEDYSTQKLIALQGVLNSFQSMYDGFSLHFVKVNDVLRIFVNHSKFATLEQPAISTLNGHIHIIDKVLQPFLPDDNVPTLNETLSSHPQYQLFYQAMQITGVLDGVKDLDEYTIFVPPNDAIKQLNVTVNADFMKYYIVPKLVFTPSILDSDSFETLLGSKHKLLMSVSQNGIKVNEVQITRPDILLDGGVMHELAGVIHPILNRCDFNSTQMNISECGDCTNMYQSCPQDYFPLSPPRIIKYECSFKRYPDAGWQTIGCQQICIKNTTKLECCGGFFGPFCKECPGGAENPCSGNGRCDGGLEGSGTCSCGRGFSGPNCGSCEDSSLVPPSCNFTYNSCRYKNGNCSENAVCSEMNNGVSCRCRLGYVGDGYICRSQCEVFDNGRCHPQASCVFNESKRATQCTCEQGFHGNGTWCQQNIDACVLDNGGCDLNRAACTFMIPKVTDMFQVGASCECKQGYIGDGMLCVTDIMDAISRIPDLRYFYTRLQEDEKLKNINVTQMLGDPEARSTVFLPVSKDWKTLDLFSLTLVGEFHLPSYQEKADDDSNIVEDNSTFGHFLEQLVSLNGQTINLTVNDRKQFLANDVMIVRANIETQNGVLHLTEVPIFRTEQALVAESRPGGDSNSVVVIAVVVVAVVVVLVLLASVAVIYLNRNHEGFFQIFKRYQSNSESNISFAQLSAQEEEEDTFKIPENARYDNPIFNDPDLL